MIRRLGVENRQNNTPLKYQLREKNAGNVNFTGLGSALGQAFIKGMQRCEAEPMINVSVLDFTTAIIPRSIAETVVASKQTDENGNPVLDEKGKQKRKLNIFAGFEAFRRESSGLLINCLLPGAFVLGAAKLLNGPFHIMGKNSKSNLVHNWSDKATLDVLNRYYRGTGTQNYTDMIKHIFMDLKGVDGRAIDTPFANLYKGAPAEFDKLFLDLARYADSEKINKKALESTIKDVIKRTHISENIKFSTHNPHGEYFGNSLESLLRNIVEVLHDAKNAGIDSSDSFSQYIMKAKKLTRLKSHIGMAFVIPLAISAQPINRWITHKIRGKKGAPIYNDEEERHLSADEKAKLLKQKFVSIGSMLGLSWLSMMKMPSIGMLEFKKYFPSMDQARIVSTATFASRMGASEDFNDWRESTVRDLATFASFYFLGDYAAKAIATIIEKVKPDVKLINELKPLKEGSNVLQKLWHWTKNTAIKSTEELSSKEAANLRSVCQLGNLAFSFAVLGLFIPFICRTKTDKNEQERKQTLSKNNENAANALSSTTGFGTTGTGASTMGAAATKISSGAQASVRGWELDLVDKNSTAFGTFLNS